MAKTKKTKEQIITEIRMLLKLNGCDDICIENYMRMTEITIYGHSTKVLFLKEFAKVNNLKFRINQFSDSVAYIGISK